VDVAEFMGIERVGDTTWQLEVAPHIVTPGDFLFGGCGLAAGIVALEEAAGRPTVWSTAQYLSYAPLGATMRVEVTIAVAGHQTTQARATGWVEDREILTVNAALGRTDLDLDGVWVEPPSVPEPDRCPPRRLPDLMRSSIFEHVEARVATGRSYEELDGTPGDPCSALWCRVPGHLEPSAATLAIFGDFLSGSVSHPIGRRVMGRSLDNTLRTVRLEPTEWVLCDMRMHAAVGGYAQGIAFLWSERGTLLGTASQSVAVKEWRLGNGERGARAVKKGATSPRPS
jgi:acyl-CoA thioesterase